MELFATCVVILRMSLRLRVDADVTPAADDDAAPAAAAAPRPTDDDDDDAAASAAASDDAAAIPEPITAPLPCG